MLAKLIITNSEFCTTFLFVEDLKQQDKISIEVILFMDLLKLFSSVFGVLQ